MDSSIDSLSTGSKTTNMGKTTPSEGRGPLKVIIVGGSVAGLTLAHSLHHSKIDYVVLEAGAELAPQIGASIVVLPNGARILDQLGIFDDILQVVEPVRTGLTWTGEDGKVVINSNAPILVKARYVHDTVN